jgi:hypothetical protein
MYAVQFKGGIAVVGSSAMSIAILGMGTIVIIWLWWIVRKNRGRGTLGSDEFLKSYGTLT